MLSSITLSSLQLECISCADTTQVAAMMDGGVVRVVCITMTTTALSVRNGVLPNRQ